MVLGVRLGKEMSGGRGVGDEREELGVRVGGVLDESNVMEGRREGLGEGEDLV